VPPVSWRLDPAPFSSQLSIFHSTFWTYYDIQPEIDLCKWMCWTRRTCNSDAPAERESIDWAILTSKYATIPPKAFRRILPGNTTCMMNKVLVSCFDYKNSDFAQVITHARRTTSENDFPLPFLTFSTS
jgi:hypothetical protein